MRFFLQAERIERRVILSAKGVERGGPHCADFVRNDVVFLVNPRCRPEGTALQRQDPPFPGSGRHPEKRKQVPHFVRDGIFLFFFAI